MSNVKLEMLPEFPTADLIPYENNARTHGTEIEQLKESITKFGFVQPILIDENNVIIAGHGRRLAAMELGMETVKAIMVHGLTDDQVKALRLADNRLAELSGWDYEVLSKEQNVLKDLGWDLSGLGFPDLSDFDTVAVEEETEDEDIITIKTDENGNIEGEEFEEGDMPMETDIQKGDMFRLGRHYLICGDSTKPETFVKLMGGVKADIAFTSPPYNAGHLGTGRARDGQKYLNDEDKKGEDEYLAFLNSNIGCLMENAEEVFYNMGVVSGSKRPIIRLLNNHINEFKDFVYWKKSNPVPAIAKNVISSAVELIIVFGDNNTRSFRHDPGIFYGVVEGPCAGNNPYSKIHRATFPLYLPTEIITKFTDENATVLDCFGGTGTTLIACEQTGRTCYMSELEPLYCQCIIDRFEKETGIRAEKL